MAARVAPLDVDRRLARRPAPDEHRGVGVGKGAAISLQLIAHGKAQNVFPVSYEL